jgi:antitoxin component YwqK of YwqJK toxin-antitoxin module
MVEDGDGVWTYWYENGQKKKEVTFENGKKNGKMTVWDIDRSILNEVFFINNKKVELNHL